MRKKTQMEKEALGGVESIFRLLNLDKNDEGYVPLQDAIAYAYAFPEEDLLKIVELLSKENYYLGIRFLESKSKSNTEVMYEAMVHTIKSAIESGSEANLKEFGLDGLTIILKGKRGEDLEKVLLAELGEKYSKYSNDEKIIRFFMKKILKVVKNEA